MTGLKIVGTMWVASIFSMGAIDTMAQIGIPEDAAQTLKDGSAQAVLSIVCLGLTGALIWLLKKHLGAKDEQLKEQKEILTEVVVKSNELRQQTNDINRAVGVGFHRFADVIQGCPGVDELSTKDVTLPLDED